METLHVFGDPEKMKSEMEKREMEEDADTLVLEGMIAHLSKDELMMLSKFFFNMADPCSLRAAYYAGALAGYNHAVNHTSIDCFRKGTQTDQLAVQIPELIVEEIKEKPLDIDEYEKNCVKYGVTALGPSLKINTEEEFERIDPSYHLTKVGCNNCGVIYPSLKDRMLSNPGIEGCSGCQQKAKHG